MLLSSAFLQLSFFIENPLGYDFGLSVISDAQQMDQAIFDETLEVYRQTWEKDQTPLIQIICGNYTWNDPDVNQTSLRGQEREVVFYLRTKQQPETVALSDDGETAEGGEATGDQEGEETQPAEDDYALAVYDKRSVIRLQASLGIVTTLFICIVLAGGSLVLSKVT